MDYATWDAVKHEIVQHLHDPELQREIAFYFSRVEAISELIETLLNYYGGIASAVGGSDQVRSSLTDLLHSAVLKRLEESDTLLSEIDRIDEELPADRWLDRLLDLVLRRG